MRELDSLGIAGRARRVDDRAEVVGTDRGQPRVDLGQVLGWPAQPACDLGLHRHDAQRPVRLQLGHHLRVRCDRERRLAIVDDLLNDLDGARRIDRHCDGPDGLDREIALEPLDAVLGHDDDALAWFHAGANQCGPDREHRSPHLRPGRHRPLAADEVMHQRTIAITIRLPEEDADCRAVGDAVGHKDGGLVYLTALIERVSVPEGTLTVILSPFFLPTSARPTGESTEIRPADGSLSTAPTR